MSFGGDAFPPDVEDEVNGFFDRIFAREITIPEVVDILKRLRLSSNPKDQHIFACLINNIFDEYRFFPKYPDNELLLTATLFGQLIQCQLISFVPLGAALRGVLDALKKPVGNKMFRFGLQALLQFQSRLPEWPQYCSHLIQLSTIQQCRPDLFAFIRSCVHSASPSLITSSSLIQESSQPVDQTSGSELLSSTLNVSTLMEAAEKQNATVPTESIRDRILFIINNLSINNVESKANDLVKVLQESHYSWLAQYLVIKRASMESNFHSLYLSFLDTLQLHQLEQQILQQTYSSIYVLLKSPKISSSSSERSLLKNLGLWLGGLTIARNRPILYRDLSLKDLLLEGYANGKLLVAIPFVCKIMEQCANSKIFRPQNPWLMGIVRVLVELYLNAELKLNLKFEVEVLCKHLDIDLKEVKPTTLLMGYNRSPNLVAKLAHPSTGRPSSPSGIFNVGFEDSSIESIITINNRILSTSHEVIFRKIVAIAVEFAIREAIDSIVSRAAAIAVSTTKVLVSLDFSSDQKDLCILAAEKSSEHLSSSLAHITAIDPLRLTISSHLKAFINAANLSALVSDSVIHTTVEDNIELATAYVEKSTIEKTKFDLDSLILSGCLQGNRVNPGSPNQISIYKNFCIGAKRAYLSSLPSINTSSVTSYDLDQVINSLRSISHLNQATSTANRAVPFQNTDTNVGIDVFFHSTCVKFIEAVTILERAVLACEVTAVSRLPVNHEIRVLMKQIILLASSSPIHRDELCLLMSQRLMQGLYKTESILYIDIIIMLLLKIFEYSAKAAKEVTTWVIYSNDERKYSVLATAALFGSGLIYVLDFDGQLAKQIESGKEAASKFAIELIRKCVFDDPPVAAPYDFVYSLEALNKSLPKSSFAKNITNLLEDISLKVKAPQPEPQQLKQSITFCFTDWFRLCQYPSISEKLVNTFVSQLFEREFLKTATSAKLFFQTCTEACIELYVRQRRAPAILSYRSIDAYGKLIGQLIKYSISGGNVSGSSLERPEETFSVQVLKTVLIIAGYILVQGLEQDLDYLQKPFTRLFISLLGEISKLDEQFSGLRWLLVECFCNFLITISPRLLPKFGLGWLETITNPKLMPSLLFLYGNQGWSKLANLLSEYFQFASIWLMNPLYETFDVVHVLCRGLTKTLLIISHDCPDFLSTYHSYLCQHLPFGPIQLKNIILAAVPNGISTPDPLSADLKVDLLPDIKQVPMTIFDYSSLARPIGEDGITCKEMLDLMIAGNQTPTTVVTKLKVVLGQIEKKEDMYMLMYAIVTFIGMTGMESLKANEAPGIVLSTSITMEFILRLLCESDGELRYFILGVLADQLRFPNRHTHYFSCVMLYLFAQCGMHNLREQLTRVLLERLIVHRPHPWGVMITFIELLKNPQYRFWENKFTRATPDIERIFESIARSCLLPAGSRDHA